MNNIPGAQRKTASLRIHSSAKLKVIQQIVARFKGKA